MQPAFPCFFLCWRRLPCSSVLNVNCLNATCNSHGHILASMIQCKRQWFNLFPGARVSTRLYQAFFRKEKLLFEARVWIRMSGGRRGGVSCHLEDLSPYSYTFPSCLPSFAFYCCIYSCVHPVVCWHDWQEENHFSLLISQVPIGNRAPQLVF